MNQTLELLDTIAVREDLPNLGLSAGEVGAVVEVLAPDRFEVEFVDQIGRPYALHTLSRTEVLPLHRKGQSLRQLGEVASERVTRSDAFASVAVRTSNAQEDRFAQRLRELLEAKRLSQQELAERIGCAQSAVARLLGRKCRPQTQTLLKLAAALGVEPRELWPDLEVLDLLDTVASFQQDDYTMTAEEASALADTATKNRPTIAVKSLPNRP